MIIISERKDLEKQQKTRKESLISDYPEIISKLSLLTLSGLNIKLALSRITDDYYSSLKDGHKPRPAYEELAYTCGQLKNGVYESLAYEELGRRCGIPCYIKFASYLVSGLKRGSSDFNRLLLDEATSSLLEQKANILQRGEIASTKLMGPMMLIFIVILILVMVPAFLSMNI